MERIRNSSYLMIFLKHMKFHTDKTGSLTELDPPEHQDYLVICLKLCQQALQCGTSSEKLRSEKRRIFGTGDLSGSDSDLSLIHI